MPSSNELPVPFDVKMMLAKLVREHNADMNRRESERAKADPKTHKLTRVMEGRHGLNYWWTYAGKDGFGRSVYFCWSRHRNAAGYFLGWRQVSGKKVTKRDQWIARKAKWRAKAVAERRAERFKVKHAGD